MRPPKRPANSTARRSGPRFGLETVAIRYFNVFGPRQDPNSQYSAVIPLFITAMLAGRQPIIYGDGRQSRDFSFVANVVHANLLAADAADVAGRVINAADGRSIDLLQLLDVLNRLLGMNVKPQFAPPRAGDVRESQADITLARRLLGLRAASRFRGGPAAFDRLLPQHRLTLSCVMFPADPNAPIIAGILCAGGEKTLDNEKCVAQTVIV